MTSSISFPLAAPNLKFQPASDPSPKFVYLNGERTDTPQTNAKGEPLFGFTAMVNHPLLSGTVAEVRVATPLEQLPKTEFGEVLELANAVVTVRNQRNGFDLAISVEADGLADGKHLPLPNKND